MWQMLQKMNQGNTVMVDTLYEVPDQPTLCQEAMSEDEAMDGQVGSTTQDAIFISCSMLLACLLACL